MTAITTANHDGTMLRVIAFSGVQARLSQLLEGPRGMAWWWVEIARQLDDLADAVRTEQGDVPDLEGFTEQIRDDAPHLMARWVRLSDDRDRLARLIETVRLQVGTDAGDASAVETITAAVRGLLARTRRFHERTTEVLLDAYERDLGGE